MAEEKEGSYVKSGDIEEWKWADEEKEPEPEPEPKPEPKATKKK